MRAPARLLPPALVAALLLAGTAAPVAAACSDAEHDAWVRSCAWAVHAVEDGDSGKGQDPWTNLQNTDALFEAPVDLAERLVNACSELLEHPDRIPAAAMPSLARAGWPPPATQCARSEHRDWLAACEADAVDLPGRTRAELLKRFRTEGGISTFADRTFVHRRCSYLKVRVHFSLVVYRRESPGDLVAVGAAYVGCEVVD